MKKNTKNRLAAISAYTLLVIVVLLLSTRESGVTITSPEKDAARIEAMAATVRSEADLRDIELLATKYEIAYQHSLGGAAALRFKALVEPTLIAAGERRDEIRAEEDYLAQAEDAFDSSLNDLDKAWSMSLGSIEEINAEIEANNKQIAGIEADIEVKNNRKESLALEIVEAGYPEDMLTELGNIENSIVELEASVADINHQNDIIRLAYRLQKGEELPESHTPANVEESVEEGITVSIEPLVEVFYDIE